jgi:DNA-3-methyladenine glycosylase I
MSEDAFDTPTIPDVIAEPRSSDVLAVMTRAVFQAGVSWAQIARNWNAYRRAFAEFDVAKVAAYNEVDMVRVLEEPGILRMRRKVDATIENARALAAVLDEFGDFHTYIASFADYPARAKDIKRRFAFMGDMNVWYLLFRLREPVPSFDTWVKTIPGEHPRMQEMVERARELGFSPEV